MASSRVCWGMARRRRRFSAKWKQRATGELPTSTSLTVSIFRFSREQALEPSVARVGCGWWVAPNSLDGEVHHHALGSMGFPGVGIGEEAHDGIAARGKVRNERPVASGLEPAHASDKGA